MTTILIPQFRVSIAEALRASFATIKECAIASDASDRTFERWWRGETVPNAAQFLLMALNSDPFSARVQILHDELKTRRTETNARLERLRTSRARAVADRARDDFHRPGKLGCATRRECPGAIRAAGVKA